MGEKLTDLPGVGPKTAKNLKGAGFDTYDKISKASTRRLARVRGIGKKGATKIIEAAGGQVITTRKKSKEERLREKYSDQFDLIEETTADEIEEEILEPTFSHGFAAGETDRPDDTVFVPTTEETAESPFRVSAEGPRKRSVEKIHQSRTERSQDVDERQNAPVTTNETKWIENKNRYDYPGVDTIPESRIGARAERAAEVAKEQGALDRVEQKGQAKTLGGKFSPPGADVYGKDESIVRVQDTAEQPERALAHEVAHAFDFAAGEGEREWGLQNELFDDDPGRTMVGREFDDDTDPYLQQAYELSERARSGGKGTYRRKPAELTADAISQAILNPRATKREAPDLFGRIKEKAEEHGFEAAIPDPLESDPERRGFLE